MSKVEESQIKRRKMMKTTFLMLPDDLVLNCLARVSRLYYRSLSLVSKRFCSLLASTELYETRTLLGRKESCLYVSSLLFPSEIKPRWFTLCRRPTRNPNPNPNPNKSSANVMASVRTDDRFPMCWRSFAVIGSNIYIIGEKVSHIPSSKVFFMDCRSHTWHEAPSMRVARISPSVSVLDGKIYVAGGLRDYVSSNWIECFDPNTQTWEHLPSPGVEICGKIKSLAVDGKLFVFGDKSMVYKPKENRWNTTTLEVNPDQCCVIDNVLYHCGLCDRIEWYDFDQGRCWRDLKGLEELPKLCYLQCVKLVNYGGKIAVLWEEKKKDVWGNNISLKKIWCAEIALERRNKHEIYGKVVWNDVVLTVPTKSSSYMWQCFAVTL